MPDINLNQPDWRLWSGQALWTPGKDHLTVVGEVLIARHQNGDVYVNLAKPPLTIFTAQTAGRQWSINFIEADKSHHGYGSPPKQFIWFYLPRILAEEGQLGKGWSIERVDDTTWNLEHKKRQESIRLVLDE